MKTIWEFVIATTDEVQVSMPCGARILCVQTQENADADHVDVCLWALVDPTAKTEVRTFQIVGTGHPINFDESDYIGTYQLMAGRLVFHVFEVTK